MYGKGENSRAWSVQGARGERVKDTTVRAPGEPEGHGFLPASTTKAKR